MKHAKEEETPLLNALEADKAATIAATMSSLAAIFGGGDR